MPNVWLIKIPWEGLPLALCWSVYWPLKNLQVELSPLQMPHVSREAWEPRIWSQPTACQRNLQSASFWKAKICPGSYLGSKRATAMLQGLICFLMFTHTSKHTACLQNVPAVIWICKCVCVCTQTLVTAWKLCGQGNCRVPSHCQPSARRMLELLCSLGAAFVGILKLPVSFLLRAKSPFLFVWWFVSRWPRADSAGLVRVSPSPFVWAAQVDSC